MKTLSKLLRPLAASLTVLGGLALAVPTTAQANPLATQTTTFSGNVPGTCTFDEGANQQNVAMSLNNGVLTGTSAQIGINANGSVNVSMVNVDQTGPNNTTPTATATLNNVTGGGTLGTATKAQAMGAAALGNATNASHKVTIGMSVAGASLPGAYTATVTLQCLTP